MIVGVFFPFDVCIAIILTLAYIVCPQKWLDGKYRYVMFILLTVSFYLFMFSIYRLLALSGSPEPTAEIDEMKNIAVLGLIPWVALWYWIVPKSLLGTKPQYLTFFLTSVAVYCLGFLAYRLIRHDIFIISEGKEHVRMLYDTCFWIGIVPWIGVTHLLWPFRNVRRNRHIIFFTLLVPILALCAMLVLWGLWMVNAILFGGM